MKRYGPSTYVHEEALVPRAKGGWVLYAEVELLQRNAGEVVRLLDLGDQRLLAGEGPCGEWNAVDVLTPKESAELYQACKRIADTAN